MSGEVWTRLCKTSPAVENGVPLDCAWVAVPAEVYQTTGATKEQYDALFGAILMIVSMVIAFGLIKKAIEQ